MRGRSSERTTQVESLQLSFYFTSTLVLYNFLYIFIGLTFSFLESYKRKQSLKQTNKKKYHQLICLVSECADMLWARRHGSPAPLVCLRALRFILVHPVFIEMLLSHSMAPRGTPTDSSGAHSKNKDLFSPEAEVPVWTSWGKVYCFPMEWTFKWTFFLL